MQALAAKLVHEGQRVRVPAPVRQVPHAHVSVFRKVRRVQGTGLSVQALVGGHEGLQHVQARVLHSRVAVQV